MGNKGELKRTERIPSVRSALRQNVRRANHKGGWNKGFEEGGGGLGVAEVVEVEDGLMEGTGGVVVLWSEEREREEMGG